MFLGEVTHQMRVLDLLDDADVLQLDVEILVDTLERATDLNVIFEFDRDLMVDEGFEEAVSSWSVQSSFQIRGAEAWLSKRVIPSCVWSIHHQVPCWKKSNAMGFPFHLPSRAACTSRKQTGHVGVSVMGKGSLT